MLHAAEVRRMRHHFVLTLTLLICLLTSCAGRQSGETSLAKQPAPAGLDGQIRELAAMPAPAGVDSDVWQQLRAELLRLLSNPQKNRALSAVPVGDSAAPD